MLAGRQPPSLGVFFLTACCLLSTSASPLLADAGPPLITDDPDTPGSNRWEINFAGLLERSARERFLQSPDFDINYGLGDSLQLKIELPWLLHDTEDAPRESGLGNTQIGVKWRFMDEGRSGVSLSVYPQFEFNNPTSAALRGVVDEGTEFLLPVELERALGPVTINGEIGYSFHQTTPDEVIYGLALDYTPTKKLKLLSEIHTVAERGPGQGQRVFNLGMARDINDTYTLLASAGRSLAHPEPSQPSLIIYLGLQLHLKGPSHAPAAHLCRKTHPPFRSLAFCTHTDILPASS